MKSKLLVITSSARLGGAEKQLNLMLPLFKGHYEVHLVVLDDQGPYIEIYRSHLPEMVLVSKSSSVFRKISTIRKEIRRFEPQAVVTWLYEADVLGSIAAKSMRIRKIIGSARNTSWPNHNFVKSFILRIYARWIADTIVANSKQALEWHVIHGYPRQKFRVIQNLLDLSNIPDSTSETRFPVSLGVLSRAVQGKGHRLMFETALELQQMQYECVLAFKGEGVSRWDYLDWLESEFPTIRTIREEGTLDTAVWWNSVDIYCCLSDSWESDPNSLNEAILHLKPSIIGTLIDNRHYEPRIPQIESRSQRAVALLIDEILRSDTSHLGAELLLRRTNLISERADSKLLLKWINAISEE